MTGRRPILIGTPAYMSPEQARGEAVGVQSDIWAFGALLYEMLTGTSSFGRKTTAETLASVLESQPDYSALPPGTPRLARRVVELCLEKNLSRRMQDMGDVRILLEDALASPDRDVPAPRPAGISRRSAWIAAGVAAGVLAGMALWLASTGSGNEKPSAPIHVVVPFLEHAATFPFGQRYLAISADGSTIALAGVRRLWIRRFDQKDSISVETGPASHPFFSPDGEWIGLFTETALVKVPSGGGGPAVITSVTDRPAGGAWRADGTIVYATSEGLYEIPADWRRTKAHCSARSRAQGGPVRVSAVPARRSVDRVHAHLAGADASAANRHARPDHVGTEGAPDRQFGPLPAERRASLRHRLRPPCRRLRHVDRSRHEQTGSVSRRRRFR